MCCSFLLWEYRHPCPFSKVNLQIIYNIDETFSSTTCGPVVSNCYPTHPVSTYDCVLHQESTISLGLNIFPSRLHILTLVASVVPHYLGF